MTSKLHALGDYVHQIRLLGTTDSFTTQIVSCLSRSTLFITNYFAQGELQHRLVKAWNERSSKNNAVPQITGMDARDRVHREMDESLAAFQKRQSAELTSIDDSSSLPPTISTPNTAVSTEQYEQKYRIAQDSSAKSRIDLYDMLEDRKRHKDTAYTVRILHSLASIC